VFAHVTPSILLTYWPMRGMTNNIPVYCLSHRNSECPARLFSPFVHNLLMPCVLFFPHGTWCVISGTNRIHLWPSARTLLTNPIGCRIRNGGTFGVPYRRPKRIVCTKSSGRNCWQDAEFSQSILECPKSWPSILAQCPGPSCQSDCSAHKFWWSCGALK